MIADALIHQRIIVDPGFLAGKPVVKGTRIPVELVLKRLAQDLDTTTLLEAYPRLTEDDVKACLAYAQQLVAGEEVCLALPTTIHMHCPIPMCSQSQRGSGVSSLRMIVTSVNSLFAGIILTTG